MALRRRLRTSAHLAAALALAACGSTATRSPSPLSVAQLQSRYLAAANAYNSAEGPIAQRENTDCAGPTADLGTCRSALSDDRKATVAFDAALAGIAFPTAYRQAVSKLLQDDSQLEQTLQQAAAATSLASDAPQFLRISQLLVVATQDGAALRSALSLPAGSSSPSPVA